MRSEENTIKKLHNSETNSIKPWLVGNEGKNTTLGVMREYKPRNSASNLGRQPKLRVQQPRIMRLQRHVEPVLNQPTFLRGPRLGDYSPEAVAATTVEPYDAAKQYVKALHNPFDMPSGEAHVLDPFTAVPCEAVKHGGLSMPTIHNGASAADGSVAFFVRGDALATIYYPASIDASSNVTWTGGTVLDTYGTYTNAYYYRPVVTFARIKVFQTGDPHVVTVCSYRLNPFSTATQAAASVAKTSGGVTTAQREWLSGVESELAPDSSYDVVCHASRGTVDQFIWTTATVDRGINGFMGACVWLYGLRSTDRVEITYGSHAEFMPVNATAVLNYANLAAVNPNPAATTLAGAAADVMSNTGADVVVNKATAKPSNTINKILNIIDNEKVRDSVDNGVKAIEKAFEGDLFGAAKEAYSGIKRWIFNSPIVLRTLDGNITLPSIMERIATQRAREAKATSAHSSRTTSSKAEEEKSLDDAEIVTPTSARRPSLALSLSARKK
jgi:hypothetical protein